MFPDVGTRDIDLPAKSLDWFAYSLSQIQPWAGSEINHAGGS